MPKLNTAKVLMQAQALEATDAKILLNYLLSSNFDNAQFYRDVNRGLNSMLKGAKEKQEVKSDAN